MARSRHLAEPFFKRVDVDRDVVQPFAVLLEPLVVDARPADRLDQLQLRVPPAEPNPHHVLAALAAVAEVRHRVRAVGPATPRAEAEGRQVLLHRRVQVAHDDPDLSDRPPGEHRYGAHAASEPRAGSKPSARELSRAAFWIAAMLASRCSPSIRGFGPLTEIAARSAPR